MKLVCAISVLYSVFVFGVLLFSSELRAAMTLAVLAAVPFLALTLIRYLCNAPRPYELISFYAIPPKKKKGKSFPSRHVFSAFLIAVLAFPTLPVLSSVLLLLGVALAVSRVLLGIHFIRDVLAGAVIGAISGAIAHLIIYLI